MSSPCPRQSMAVSARVCSSCVHVDTHTIERVLLLQNSCDQQTLTIVKHHRQFWSLLGAGAFKFLSWLVPSDGLTEPEIDMDDSMEAGTDVTPSSVKLKALERRNIRLAAVMMTTLTAHNLPEGVAVAFSTLENQKLGVMVTFAIAVHNIPEGLAIAIPVYASTSSRWKAMLATTLSGLSEPIGALIGLLVLKPVLSQTVLHNILFFVAGMMAAVSIFELIPEGMKYNEPRAQGAGIAAGFICMLWTYTYDV